MVPTEMLKIPKCTFQDKNETRSHDMEQETEKAKWLLISSIKFVNLLKHQTENAAFKCAQSCPFP